jgi:hydrogenase maturation factor
MTRIVEAGKLPNKLLQAIISKTAFDDPSLIVGPGVGEDAAVVEPEASSLLVLKTDPITFAADRIGFYAVNVNANDVVTTGATPRWFLPTLLLPVNTTEAEVRRMFAEIVDAASAIGVIVCGGHSSMRRHGRDGRQN